MFAVGILLKEGGSTAGWRINLTGDGMVGMIPVFETREDAEKAYPNMQIIEIEEQPHD